MSFVSDTMGIPVIENTNDIHVSLRVSGRGYEQRDRTVDPEGGFAKPMTFPKLSRQEIKERAKDREQSKLRIFDIMAQAGVKPMNQGQTPLCWAFGTTDAIQIAEILSGRPYEPLSPASVAAPLLGWRMSGGWAIKYLKYACEHGVATQATWPPTSFNRSSDNAASQASRQLHAPAADGWIDLPEGDWDAVFTCLVMGFPCTLAHMEWQHLVTAIDVMILSNGELAALCRNSGYGRDSSGHSIVKESFGRPDEAMAVQVVTGG